MNKFVCLIIITSLFLITGCRSHNAAAFSSLSDLNGEWDIVELDGTALNFAGTRHYLAFDMENKRISGYAGCNRIIGSLVYENERNNAIRFPQISTTRMACPDMKSEQELLQILDRVERFTAEDKSTIAFFDKNGEKIMVLSKN